MVAASPSAPEATERRPAGEPHRVQSGDAIPRAAWWILFAVVAAVVLFIRLRLLEIPLERDEGEYAYSGQLLLQGVPPYASAYNMKLPGTYAAYAAIMAVFGQTTSGIHLGLLLVNAATVALVFLLGKQLLDLPGATAAAGAYAVLSVSPGVLGSAGHATHFVVLPVLGALLLLLQREPPGKQRIFVAGTLLGVGVLMKQPGIFFLPLGAICLTVRDWRAGATMRLMALRLSLLLGGFVLPLAATCLLLWWGGVFDKFWFWTVVYAREYGALVPLSQAPEVFLRAIKNVIAPAWPVWAFAAVGLIACVRHRSLRTSSAALVGLLVVSALAVTPGLYFRKHYFILALPAIALLAGAAVAWAGTFRAWITRGVALLLVAGGFTSALYVDRAFFFQLGPAAASRLIYGANPFPEAERVAAFLRDRTLPEDTIAVMGSEPEILFHARRRSATGYIYIYSLMEAHQHALQMQREMMAEIQAANPKYLVLVAINASWLGHANSEKLIFKWMNDYIARHFKLVGLVDIVSNERTEYYLPASEGATATADCSLMIYERL